MHDRKIIALYDPEIVLHDPDSSKGKMVDLVLPVEVKVKAGPSVKFVLLIECKRLKNLEQLVKSELAKSLYGKVSEAHSKLCGLPKLYLIYATLKGGGLLRLLNPEELKRNCRKCVRHLLNNLKEKGAKEEIMKNLRVIIHAENQPPLVYGKWDVLDRVRG